MNICFRRRCGRLVLVLCLAASVRASDVFPRSWLPISPQDLQIKEVPGGAGAEAIQLYYADEIEESDHDEFFYSRVKILTEAGKSHGDVQLPVFPGTSIHELEARTIHPDGSIVMFSGSAFEKTILQAKGIKIIAKAFVFPEVTPGSIIEYKYRLHRDDKSVADQVWVVQHDIYTVQEHFWYRYDKRGGTDVAFAATPGLKANPLEKMGAFEMRAENIPAFEKEELMPPEDGYRLSVRFFHGGPEVRSSLAYWNRYGSTISEYFREFVVASPEVKKLTEQTIGNETDPEKKLRKLYDRVQQVRNLTFEHDRTSKEQKQEHLKRNTSIDDVVKHGYGENGEIAALYVAMARAAGFETSLMLVSNRSKRLFNQDILSFDQFDGLIARVWTPLKTWYLDPGTRFCPFGTVRWMHAATAAMDLKQPGRLIPVPSYAYDTGTTTRAGQFSLQSDGKLSGTVTLSFGGSEALEHRLFALETDAAGRNKELEQDLKALLPAESSVQLLESHGWTAENEPLSATFSVEIPAYASVAGKRMLVPAGLFNSVKKIRFEASTRKYPVYFPYAFMESDKIAIAIPEGYSAESVPEPREAKLPYANYSRTAKMNSKGLTMERVLQFNGIIFTPNLYPELKDFFTKVNTGDESQSVLRLMTANPQDAN
jgi:hypothetical protein